MLKRIILKHRYELKRLLSICSQLIKNANTSRKEYTLIESRAAWQAFINTIEYYKDKKI